MVPSLESIPICTQRLFPRPMMYFASITHQQIARVFLVTAPARVFIKEDLGTRLLHLLLVPMTPFTGMSCATTVIGLVTNLVDVIYLISVGMAHSPSSLGVFPIRTPQFRNTLSMIIISFSTPVPPLVISWTLLYYHILIIVNLIQLLVCFKMVGI